MQTHTDDGITRFNNDQGTILQAHIDNKSVPKEIRDAAIQISDTGLGILKKDNIDHSYCSVPWIAGGSLRSIIEGVPRTDLDCYFSNDKDFNETYVSIVTKSSLKAKIIHDDEMVTSLDTSIGKVDLVRRFHKNPVVGLWDFDFTCCQLAIDMNKNVYWGEHTLEHIRDKKLVISNPQNPFGTMLRLQKYAVKGYSISVEEAEKLAYSIKHNDFHTAAGRLKKRCLY
jgi:hypothetical protein